MSFYIELGALLAIIFILYLFFRFLKDPVLILWNSVFGIIVFFALDYFFGLGIPISFFSIAIVAVGGFAGLVFVILLHFLGIAF